MVCFLDVKGQAISKRRPGEKGQVKKTSDLNITDQERHLGQNYINEIGIQKKIKEECEKLEQLGVCHGREVKTKVLGLSSKTVQLASRMYSIVLPAISTFSGGGGQSRDGGASEGPKKDYCQYIALGTEALALFKQQETQKELTKDIKKKKSLISRQKAALYNAAKTHKQRSDNHKAQALGWKATTGCYVFYAVKSKGDIKAIAKLGAAGFMAYFFSQQAKSHEKYYKEVRKIADDLPSAGDCNPITERDCFCSKPKLSDSDLPLYKKYCDPNSHNQKVKSSDLRVPCLDQNLQADPKCICLNEDACFDKKYFEDIKHPGLQQFVKTPEASDFRALTRGVLKGGRLKSGSAKQGATTRNLLDGLRLTDEKLDIPQYSLNGEQEDTARLLIKGGLPASLAAATASKFSKVKGARRGIFKKRERRHYRGKSSGKNIWKYSNDGKGSIGIKGKKSSNNFNSLLNKYRTKKGRRPSNKSRVLNYDDQIYKNAEISKRKDVSIFNVISNRYRLTKWRELSRDP